MMHSEEIIDDLLNQVAKLKAERDALLVERQPLSDEQITEILGGYPADVRQQLVLLVRAVEALHGIGGAT